MNIKREEKLYKTSWRSWNQQSRCNSRNRPFVHDRSIEVIVYKPKRSVELVLKLFARPCLNEGLDLCWQRWVWWLHEHEEIGKKIDKFTEVREVQVILSERVRDGWRNAWQISWMMLLSSIHSKQASWDKCFLWRKNTLHWKLGSIQRKTAGRPVKN